MQVKMWEISFKAKLVYCCRIIQDIVHRTLSENVEGWLNDRRERNRKSE